MITYDHQNRIPKNDHADMNPEAVRLHWTLVDIVEKSDDGTHNEHLMYDLNTGTHGAPSAEWFARFVVWQAYYSRDEYAALDPSRDRRQFLVEVVDVINAHEVIWSTRDIDSGLTKTRHYVAIHPDSFRPKQSRRVVDNFDAESGRSLVASVTYSFDQVRPEASCDF